MYCYKLNNSYTVYVNYIYLNDCIKASKKEKKSRYQTATRKKNNNVFSPLPKDTLLSHKTYGLGRVVSSNTDGIMSVEFDSKVAKFLYPDAVHKGFLERVYC